MNRARTHPSVPDASPAVTVIADPCGTALLIDHSPEGHAAILGLFDGLAAGARPLPRTDMPSLAEQVAAFQVEAAKHPGLAHFARTQGREG